MSTSDIYIYTDPTNPLNSKKRPQKIGFHTRGVQSMSFSPQMSSDPNPRWLVSVGVQGDDNVALHELSSKDGPKWAPTHSYATNAVRFNPYETSKLQFWTVGNEGCITVWSYDSENDKLVGIDIMVTKHYRQMNFLCIDFTPSSPLNKISYALIGASDGSVIRVLIDNNGPEI